MRELPELRGVVPADGAAADVDALRPGTRRRGPQSRTVRMGAALYSGTSAPAVDLEELGRLHAGAAGAAGAGGVEVHYEDGARAGDVPHRDRRVAERAAAACAPDACQPLDPAAAAPPVPSRRGKASAASAAKEKEKEKEEEDKQSTSATDNEEEDDDERCCALHKLCMCELRRHRGEDDCWLAAYGNVYNVTGILRAHPGGARCLLRKAGGPDCSADMDFHTKKARRMMEQCFIGRLEPCGEPDASGQAACAVM